MSNAPRNEYTDDIHPGSGTRRWQDKLFSLRDSLLRNPLFHRFSADFPLSRGIARREAQDLFDLCAGFVYSQILFACVTLGVFDALRDGPASVAKLSQRLSLSVEATERLLRGAVALRLVSKRGNGEYGLGMLGAALSGNPGLAAMIRHHAMLYRDLADPVSLLRGESKSELSRYWAYASERRDVGLQSADVSDYSALMTASQAMISGDILDAYPMSRHLRLLDIGGGEGAFVEAAAARYAQLSFDLFDLASVAECARARLSRSGIGERVNVIGGDFKSDALPRGADIVALVRIVHDHDDPVVLMLLRKIREILPANGALLIAEPLAGTPGAERVGDAYFGFYLLAMGQGRPRTVGELSGMLRESGFGHVRALRTRRPMLTAAILATP